MVLVILSACLFSYAIFVTFSLPVPAMVGIEPRSLDPEWIVLPLSHLTTILTKDVTLTLPNLAPITSLKMFVNLYLCRLGWVKLG
jgi:hypothetical protein